MKTKIFLFIFSFFCMAIWTIPLLVKADYPATLVGAGFFNLETNNWNQPIINGVSRAPAGSVFGYAATTSFDNSKPIYVGAFYASQLSLIQGKGTLYGYISAVPFPGSKIVYVSPYGNGTGAFQSVDAGRGIAGYVSGTPGTYLGHYVCNAGDVLSGTTCLTPVNGACGSSNGASLITAPTSGFCNSGIFSGLSGSGPWTWNCWGVSGGTTSWCWAGKAAPNVNCSRCSSTYSYAQESYQSYNADCSTVDTAITYSLSWNGATCTCGKQATDYSNFTNFCAPPVCEPTENNQVLNSQPTLLCANGSKSGLSGNGWNTNPWLWSCTNWNTGAVDNCKATITSFNGTCGSANGQYSAAQPTANLCASGNPTGISGSGSQTNPWSWTCQGQNTGTSQSCTSYMNLPTTSISATAPASLGGKATITWSSTNTTSCTASGDWSGAKSTSGTDNSITISTTGNKTFTITCQNGAGDTNSSSTTICTPQYKPSDICAQTQVNDGCAVITGTKCDQSCCAALSYDLCNTTTENTKTTTAPTNNLCDNGATQNGSVSDGSDGYWKWQCKKSPWASCSTISCTKSCQASRIFDLQFGNWKEVAP